MGRLFWKFFLVIWLAQLVAIAGTGFVFWLEHQAREAHWRQQMPLGMPPPPPPGHFSDAPLGPMPEGMRPPPPHGPHGGPPVPALHIISGLLASLLSAAGIAWYIAKPIRRLRQAFEAAADGDLQAKIGDSMGARRDELADLGRDFDRMTERLRLLIEGQKRLLHDVSHELRSPLARLHAAIGLIRQQPARLEDSLVRLEREGERMNRLVGELLTLSRLEAGAYGVLDEVNLGELLDEVLSDARFEGAARHVWIEAPAMPDVLLRAPGEMLQRALDNVLRNALRHAPAESVVQVQLSLTPASCRIAIVDQGPGVPEAQLEAIFTPFFRGEAQGEGYGLGLAIARRVVLATGGQIRASNHPAGGFCVEIDLPLQPS